LASILSWNFGDLLDKIACLFRMSQARARDLDNASDLDIENVGDNNIDFGVFWKGNPLGYMHATILNNAFIGNDFHDLSSF
jgi:hypothetical protein